MEKSKKHTQMDGIVLESPVTYRICIMVIRWSMAKGNEWKSIRRWVFISNKEATQITIGKGFSLSRKERWHKPPTSNMM